MSANEDAYASTELFGDLEKTFGTGRGRFKVQTCSTCALCCVLILYVCLFTARGMDMEAAKPKFMMTKVKELKVLDAKAAQNICKSLPAL